MILYMELSDNTMSPYIDGTFKTVNWYTITVFGTDILVKTISPDRFSDYSLGNIISILGQMGWFCLPNKGDLNRDYWCYKQCAGQEQYDKAIADMRMLITPLNDTETDKAIRKAMREWSG